jgi:hypothetical protein
MSINAFFDAYSGIQNALGDPRAEEQKRREQELIMQQRQQQMQASGYALQQQQQEDQRKAREMQMQQRRAQSRFGFVGGSMYPNARPAQPQPAPMGGQSFEPNMATQGRPIMQQGDAPVQGQSFVDPMSGKEGASYTATAQGRGPMPDGQEELDFLLRDAYDNNDVDGFNALIDQRRSAMSEQEKIGGQKLAIAANQISQLQTHEERVEAVKQVMRNLGVSPDDTTIDDYFNNPQALMRELNLVSALGDPGESVKQMTEQQYAPAQALDLGNRKVLYGGQGDTIQNFNVGVNPTQARGQNISAATARRGQNMTDARAMRSQQTNLPAGFVLNGN